MMYKLYFQHEGEEWPVLFSTCQGCENLTVGACGWFCGYAGDGCEYPDQTIEQLKAIKEGEE